MGKHLFGLALACAALAGNAPVRAQETIVDVQLVIAADISLSMSYEELELQREGYIAALTHDSVIEVIEEGTYGRVAVAMFEWAGDYSQHLIVPWTMISSRADAERIADLLRQTTANSARRTSISGALDFAGDLFAESGYRGLRRVVDISGDGPNNQGRAVTDARDALVAQGIQINGLPLMTNGGYSTMFDVPDLDIYYTQCVIGGPGAFMIPVNGWDQFPEAVRRKLVLELAGGDPRRGASGRGLPFIHVAGEAAYDCLVGEKRWQRRYRNWSTP